MSNFSTNILTNIELLLSFHDTMRRPQMLLESSRPMVSLGSVILLAFREITVTPQLFILLSIHLYNLNFFGKVVPDIRCALLLPFTGKVDLIFVNVFLNGKQSVTLCLVFRPFKRCLNGVKRSKRFGILTLKYAYLCT